jgi:Family of unknown function (DUF6266)
MKKNFKIDQTGTTAIPQDHPAMPGGFRKRIYEQQIKIHVMTRYMRSLRPFMNMLGMSLSNISMYHPVLKENVKHAFKGNFPSWRIHYSKVMISKGKLPNPPGLSVCSPERGRLFFQWRDQGSFRKVRFTDLLFVAVFNCDSRRWILYKESTKRADCQYLLDAGTFQGKLVQVYAGFVSADGKRVSTSLFLGELRVL